MLLFIPSRALRKNPSARERPPLVILQKTRKAGGEMYMVRGAQRNKELGGRESDKMVERGEDRGGTERGSRVYKEGKAEEKLGSRGGEVNGRGGNKNGFCWISRNHQLTESKLFFSADCTQFRKSCFCQSSCVSMFVPPEGADTTTVTGKLLLEYQ